MEQSQTSEKSMETKKQIRTEILKRRSALSKDEVADKSRAICRKIVSCEQFVQAEIILLYLDFISFLKYIYSSLSIRSTYLRYNLPIILNGFNKARNLILIEIHIANFYLKVHVRLNIQI